MDARRRLDIHEVRTDDGGVGIAIGERGTVYMGHDGAEIVSLLTAYLEGTDADLEDAITAYLAREHKVNTR